MAIASVTGPVEAKAQFSTYKGMHFDVSVRPASGMASAKERDLERRVASLLGSCVDCAAYPYTQLNVSVEVCSDDGSTESAVMNAAILAVVHAGVKMTTIPLTVSIAGSFMDPDAQEEKKSLSVVHVSICMQSGKVVHAAGPIDFHALTMSQAAVEALSPVIRKSLADHMSPALNRLA